MNVDIPFSTVFKKYQNNNLIGKAELYVTIAPTTNNGELCRTLLCVNEHQSGFTLFKSPSYYITGFINFTADGNLGYQITDVSGWNAELIHITQIICIN